MSLPLATIGPSAYWYLARGTGVVSLLLLSASVVLGVLGPLRFSAGPRWPRFAIDTLHRDVSLLVIGVLVVHIITSILDSFAPIRLTDAVIPLGADYRPLWLGLGALSFDILLALVLTSLVRRRLGLRAWRAVHWLAYASWPVAVLHGLGTGSDTKAWWMLALTAACVGAVVVAVGARIRRVVPEREGLRIPALGLTLATPLGLAIFTLAGPLQLGWARRAGTPTTLLGKVPAPAGAGTRSAPSRAAASSSPSTKATASSPRSTNATASSPRTTLSAPFSARLRGTVTETPEPGGAIDDLSLRLSGGARGRLRVRLAGTPIDGGGLSMTGSQVDLLTPGLSSAMAGRVVSLQGRQFVARVSGASGSALDLRGVLNLDGRPGSVTGILSATAAGSGG
ncbi:MAG: ferric reductase-like transmembrane domain-containing protein [Solirubrobacteraceae bacterium]